MSGGVRVYILYGGVSAEHEVSCLSAATIVRALQQRDLSLTLIGITKNGEWFLQPRAVERDGRLTIARDDASLVRLIPGHGFQASGAALEAGVVFPALHGSFGEDGGIQALLEHCAMPYVGSDQHASTIGMHKLLSKLYWQQNQLPIVEYCLVSVDEQKVQITSELNVFVGHYGYPLFVKPCNGGSSIGVSKVRNERELLSALEQAARYDRCLLCERAINGREIEFAVFDTVANESVVSVGGEIVTEQELYDYDTKYLHTDRATLIAPAELDDQLQSRMQQAALRAYQVIGCRDLARVDFLLEDDGRYYINEINTLPGLTTQSMFPILCDLSDHPLADLLMSMIQRAMIRSGTARHAK